MKNWMNNAMSVAKKAIQKIEEIDSQIAQFEQKVLKTERLPSEIVDEKVEAGINTVVTKSTAVCEKVKDSSVAVKERGTSLVKKSAPVKKVLRQVKTALFNFLVLVEETISPDLQDLIFVLTIACGVVLYSLGCVWITIPVYIVIGLYLSSLCIQIIKRSRKA